MIKTQGLSLQVVYGCDSCGEEFHQNLPYDSSDPPDPSENSHTSAYIEVIGAKPDDENLEIELKDLCTKCINKIRRFAQNLVSSEKGADPGVKSGKGGDK